MKADVYFFTKADPRAILRFFDFDISAMSRRISLWIYLELHSLVKMVSGRWHFRAFVVFQKMGTRRYRKCSVYPCADDMCSKIVIFAFQKTPKRDMRA